MKSSRSHVVVIAGSAAGFFAAIHASEADASSDNVASAELSEKAAKVKENLSYQSKLRSFQLQPAPTT